MNTLFNAKLGEKLKEMRLKKGLTQEQIGKKLGLTKACIGLYENGKRSIYAKTLLDICKICDYDANELMKDLAKYIKWA